MSKDTDRTPGDDLVYERLVEPHTLIERRPQGRFVLVPVDDRAPITDDFSTLIRNDKPLHIEFERSLQGRFVLEPVEPEVREP